MQFLGDQQAVWDAVGQATSHFDAQTDSGTYEALIKSPEAQAAVTPYVNALGDLTLDSGNGQAVGAVVAINGRVICADVYSNPSLFGRIWPSLLRSYALQAAIDGGKTSSGAPGGRDVSLWLQRLDGAPGAQSDGSVGTEVARVCQSDGAGVRSATTVDGRPQLIHEAFWSPDSLTTNRG